MTIYSTVLILPEDKRQDGNAVAIALGQDVPPGNTYSVALSPSGLAPATHFGCHVWARPAFISQMQDAENGQSPDIPGVDMAALMLSLIKSVRPESANPLDHFNEVLASNGLQRIEDV